MRGETTPGGLLQAWATFESGLPGIESADPQVFWEQGYEVPLVGPSAPEAIRAAAENLAERILREETPRVDENHEWPKEDDKEVEDPEIAEVEDPGIDSGSERTQGDRGIADPVDDSEDMQEYARSLIRAAIQHAEESARNPSPPAATAPVTPDGTEYYEVPGSPSDPYSGVREAAKRVGVGLVNKIVGKLPGAGVLSALAGEDIFGNKLSPAERYSALLPWGDALDVLTKPLFD